MTIPANTREAPKGCDKCCEYLRYALEWIDALPKDVVASLPPMPGFDRDAAEQALSADSTSHAGEASTVPPGWKLVRVFDVGDRVLFRGVKHTIFARGDKPGTFDIHQPGIETADRWVNVPPDQLSDVPAAAIARSQHE